MKHRFIHDIDNAYIELSNQLKEGLNDLHVNPRATRFFDRVNREFKLIATPIFDLVRHIQKLSENNNSMITCVAIFCLLKEQESEWTKTRIKPGQTITPQALESICSHLHQGKSITKFKGRELQPQNLINYYLNSLRRFYIEADHVVHLTQAQLLLNKHTQASTNSLQLLTALALFLETRNGLPKPIVNSVLPEGISAYAHYQTFSEQQLQGIIASIELDQKRQALNFKVPEENRERKRIHGEMLEILNACGVEKADRYIHRLSQGKTIHCCKIKGNTCMRCPYNVGFQYDKKPRVLSVVS